jgi:hypothetical protein
MLMKFEEDLAKLWLIQKTEADGLVLQIQTG